MQENKSSNKQNEKVKDNQVKASKIKVDAKDNSKQTLKVETKVQDKKKIGLILALIATILVIAILGMTAYSRYRSRIGGQGTAPVAAWSFKVNGSEEAIASFDLGTTRNDANGKVADGVIAPGTSGRFDIEIDGSESEVAIEYFIEIDASNMPTNLKLYRDANHTQKIEDVSRNAKVQGYIELKDINTKVTETIYWEWPYRTGETEEEKLANDKIDSQEMGQAVQMPIKVVGIQSNPNKQSGETISRVINVGDTINYSPSGTYNWNQDYATSDTTGTTTLSSAQGQSYNITTWKVLSVDRNTGEIEMVPAAPTSGTVRLQGAQGYNNAVYLLNEACSALYSDYSKGITARSIKEEDFVTAGGTAWTNHRASYSNGNATYGNQYTSAYTSNKYYPSIYAKEKNSVINGTKSLAGYSQSEQTSLIGRTDNSATNGYLQASSSIQPYQTYYNTSDYNTTAGLLGNYAGILLPNRSSTNYWVVSRSAYLGSGACSFGVRIVNSGFLDSNYVFSSSGGTGNGSRAVFPVVSLSSKLLETTATDGTYNVK